MGCRMIMHEWCMGCLMNRDMYEEKEMHESVCKKSVC